jgi:hypothetical protein
MGATGAQGATGATGPAGPGNTVTTIQASGGCNPLSFPSGSCLTTLTATCPAGTVVAGCGMFQAPPAGVNGNSLCTDGTNGVADVYINSANGCSGQAFNNTPHGICTPGFTASVILQARCINVP